MTTNVGPRRTFAVISHPDAGKSTLTEALALHARVVSEAGAVHGKAGRRGTISDWMALEKARGISITSTAMTFHHRETALNLVDTPGHADFSEDTYRSLAAVDSALMLIDAAKGLEPQTLKLFRVCRRYGIPVITVINKWDRPGLEPLELLDQIQTDIGLTPTPLTWPIGDAGDFRGVLDRTSMQARLFTRTAGGATRAPERMIEPAQLPPEMREPWQRAVEEHQLLSLEGLEHDTGTFLAGQTTPVVFVSALLNFGVAHLLDLLTTMAPPPRARVDVDGRERGPDDDFSAFVFKVQSGLNPAHRDRMAFARVCSGVFHRGMTATNHRTGRTMATKYAQTVVGRQRDGVEEAHPGDIIGLVNVGDLTVGDTLYDGEPVRFPPVDRFEPEHFAVATPRDLSRHKQFRTAIQLLDEEGAVQVLRSERRGQQAPVLAAVGLMQFEVVSFRIEHEYGCPIDLAPLPYTLARQIDPAGEPIIQGDPRSEALTRSDGAMLALFRDRWHLETLARRHPDLRLEATPARTEPVVPRS